MVAKELAHLPKKTRRTKAAFMMYNTWNIWKERYRRVFENKQGSPTDVLHEIKMEVQTRQWHAEGQRFLSYLMLRFSIVFEYFLFYVISNL